MIEWFERGSYLGIVFFLTLTGIGLPIPEEVPIVAAGIASRTGALHWYYALPACLVGALLGDSLMYSIGYFFGAKVLKEHPLWAGFLTAEREQKIESLIKKHGIKAFFVARFLVGLRSPFYLTAGILKVPYRWFLFADGISSHKLLYRMTQLIQPSHGLRAYPPRQERNSGCTENSLKTIRFDQSHAVAVSPN